MFLFDVAYLGRGLPLRIEKSENEESKVGEWFGIGPSSFVAGSVGMVRESILSIRSHIQDIRKKKVLC